MSSILKEKVPYTQIDVADEEWFEHIHGFNDVVAAAKSILKSAKMDVYINADFPITQLREELEFLVDNNINVCIFSFYNLGKIPAGINVYSHNHKMKINHVCTRLMIAVDEQEILIADSYGEDARWRGTRTNNPLMVDVVCEHIHNDIYLMQIRQKYGREIYDNVKTHDNFEKGRMEMGIF